LAIEIILGGENVRHRRLAASALSWTDQVDGRGTASIAFVADYDDPWRPEDGRELLVVNDDPFDIATSDGALLLTSDDAQITTGPARLFGGVLMEPQEMELQGTTPPMIVFECSAAEFSSICDRRLVARLYENQPVDAIVLDILARDLDGEGIMGSGVVEGPIIEKAVFADASVTEVLNELAELTGYAWRVDPYKVLHFRPRSSMLAAIPLDGDTLLGGTVRVRRDRERYRNLQVVRAGTDLTDPRAETLVGDGERRVFATAFPLGGVPTVELSRSGGAFAPQTVGILGVEQNREWYWNSGLAQVSQDDDGDVLAAPTTPGAPETGDRVRVTYRGLFPVKTQYRDAAEIAARGAIEGGSGIYAHVEDRPQINSAQSALETALALIERYGRIGTVVEGRTRAAIYEPGQVVTVNLPRHKLFNAEMLIDSVSAEYNDELGEVWYTVRAISGDPFGGWQEYFRKLTTAGRSMVVGREGEVLALARIADELVLCADGVSVDYVEPESRIGIMAVGIGQIGESL